LFAALRGRIVMDTFWKLAQQLRLTWLGMSRPQQVGVAATLIGVLALAGAVIFVGSHTEYHVLCAGLAPEDAALVTAKLKAQGVNYQLGGGGTTVLVPAEQVAQLRVDLAGEGLPTKGDKGFGLFDQTGFGTTPFTQHVNYQRALQAELAKTIMQIDPIISARVHIGRPEPSAFMNDRKPTTASVIVKLRPSAALSRHVAAGIVALVSRSVEGLARENVTLVDASGRVLSDEQGSEAGQMSAQVEQRRELENYLASKAENMLAQVLGPGRAIVRVTADLNLKRLRETKETYNPDNRVATSEKTKTTKQTSTTTSAAKGGPAGTSSNLGKAPAAGGATGTNNVDEEINTSFAVSKTTQEIENKVGAIERLTVAALVDVSKAGSSSDTELHMSLADAQETIKKAVGFKSERDEIKVTQVKLTSPQAAMPDDEWDKYQQWQTILSIVRNGSLGITAVVALVLGWLLLRRVTALPPGLAQLGAPAADDRITVERLSVTLQQNPQIMNKLLTDWMEPPAVGSKNVAP
jgi:flagellar M-ring protein FliF